MTIRSDESEPIDRVPGEIFDLVSTETRIQILWALWDVFDPHGDDNTVSFSDLYDRVESSNSGNFSYHLDKLVDHLVIETNGGYRLAPAGFSLLQSILAGTITNDIRFGRTVIDALCPLCDAPVEVTYEDKYLTCYCSACDGVWRGNDGFLVQFHHPPNGVRERTPVVSGKDFVSTILH